MNNGILPNHSLADEKKLHRGTVSNSWTTPVLLPIPGVRTRRIRIFVPNVGLFPQVRGVRRSRGPFLVFFACMALFVTVILVSRRRGSSQWTEDWPTPSTDESSTLVYRREDLQRIWKWEIASGHFPSHHPIPKQVGLKTAPLNPTIPEASVPLLSTYLSPTEERDMATYGVGSKRVYLEIRAVHPNVAYPPRPKPGSVADMDIIMKHCNFTTNNYVRDCLEVLRVGGGLDNGRRIRRGNTEDWNYIYEERSLDPVGHTYDINPEPQIHHAHAAGVDTKLEPDAGLVKKQDAEWEPRITLPPLLKHRPSVSLKTPCDPENPRIYHMFWTGPFTDKPYLALLSFLFTQNTGLHMETFPDDSPVCRPEFWMWINPGPAASVPNPDALRNMYTQLKLNPWASPFLHSRFHDVIKFKLWNTTEQLDGVPEIKDEWRSFKTLFNSGGHVINVPSARPKETSASMSGNETSAPKVEEEDLVNRAGSKSSSSYDRLSVILSDMARFILCHRFGGIYLDADTIFLRDWEELWGWKGAFAYRWSRLEKYNTAVLRMHKGSPLGTFLFRTALKNGFDFHPMSVSVYTADAYLEPLLLRLPDALFDSAWLNTENYQRDRPPQPYFTEFADFFDTPAQNSAAPQALGFDGFFKGAYSYHFHNFWWKPFDPTRNWPDLGLRFKSGEEIARAALEESTGSNSTKKLASHSEGTNPLEHDKRDLDWSTVLKRTFESYIRGERPNMYGEWLQW